jgi:hypothetical protein
VINPIADAINTEIPAVNADEKRTLSGFLSFASESVEFQRFQSSMLSFMMDAQMPLSEKVYRIASMSMWLGFESGKLYVINDHVSEMLSLEDKWNRDHASE